MTPMQMTPAQKAQYIKDAIVQCVAEFGPVGNGPLYTYLQNILGQGWTLEAHMLTITSLITEGLLVERYHELSATAEAFAAIEAAKLVKERA